MPNPLNSPLSITNKQHTILELIFKYRFLNIKHIQAFLNYKDKRYIQTLLNKLAEEEYLIRIYDKSSFKTTATPAIYYLGINGIRFLRSTNNYQDYELRNRYKESTRTEYFINHCLLVADCCVTLHEESSALKRYNWKTQTDYTNLDSSLYYTDTLNELKPHLFFTREETEEKSYIVEYYQSNIPRARLGRRLSSLLKHLDQEWPSYHTPPVLLLVCDTTADLIYIKRRVQSILEKIDIYDLSVRVATSDKVKKKKLTSPIWEEIEPSY